MKMGQTVNVFNNDFHGKIIFEGKAILLEKISDYKSFNAEIWKVQFKKSGYTFNRLIREKDIVS